MPLTTPLADDAAIFEYSYTAGNSGVYQLAGAWGGFFTFKSEWPAGVASIPIRVTDGSANTEISNASYDAGANTLTVIGAPITSTNGGALVNWSGRTRLLVHALQEDLLLCATPPTLGQVLTWDGTEWCPATPGPGLPLCPTPPLDGQVLIWSAADNAYCPADFCALVSTCLMPAPVYFDGQSSALTKSSLTGVSDSHFLSFSLWIETHFGSPSLDVVDLDTMGFTGNSVFVDPNNATFAVGIGNGSQGISFKNDPGSHLAGNGFINVLCSIDTSLASPTAQLYFGDTSVVFDIVADSGPWLMSFAGLGFALPGDPSIDFPWFLGCIGEFWWAPGQLIDFSNPVNRAKFHDAHGFAVSLGSGGELPTGTSPAVYFSGDASTFATNNGTGGAFTLLHPLANCMDSLANVDISPARLRGGISLPGSTLMGGNTQLNSLVAGSKSLFTFALFVRMASLPGSSAFLMRIEDPFNPGAIAVVSLNSSGNLTFHFEDNSHASFLTFTQTSGSIPADSAWHSILASCDTSSGTFQVLTDATPASFSTAGAAGFSITFSLFENWELFGHGGFPSFSGMYVGDAAEYWVSFVERIDFSVPANVAKFVSGGQSVDLGAHGELPTGTPPSCYLSQDPQDYAEVAFFFNRAPTPFTNMNVQSAPGPNVPILPAPAPYP